MSKSYATTINEFLKTKGLKIDEELIIKDPAKAIPVKIDHQTCVFFTLRDEMIVLFLYVADIPKKNVKDIFRLTMGALKFNSFKWSKPVRFSIDEEENYIFAFCKTPLPGLDFFSISQQLNILLDATKAFRDAYKVGISNTGIKI